jgi:hypothetical protein
MVTPKSTIPPLMGGPEPSSQTPVKRYPLLTLAEMETIDERVAGNYEERMGCARAKAAARVKD